MKAPLGQKCCTAEEQRALLARLLANPAFARSARLRDFLQYTTEQCIANPDITIREPEIAERVFGRSATQNNDDSIVRVHASQLRKRLEQYFETDGASEDLILEIPRGNYTPVFRRREVEIAPPTPADPPPAARRGWMLPAVAILGILVVVLVWDDWRVRNRAPSGAGVYQTIFWSELLNSSTACNVVLADSALGYLRALSHVDLTVDQYANRDYGPIMAAIPSQNGLHDWVSMLAHRRVTSMADFSIGRKLALLAGKRAPALQFVLARDFTPDRLNTENVIFIGGRLSNPWTELVEGQLNFVYEFGDQQRALRVRNRHPRPGEPAEYGIDDSVTEKIPEGYSIVARLTKLNGNKVVMIAGTEAEGTEAGGNFILDEGSLARLHRALGAAPSEPFPDFEVLLSTTKIGGSSPVTRVIALRRH
jgi:hypothetical protein